MKRRSNKLNRQIKKTLGQEDADDLLAAAVPLFVALASDENLRVAASIVAQMPTFFEVVDKAYEEYEDRQKISERNLEISSRELNEAFRKVESLNASVNAMMDSLGQGFMFFNEEGVFSPVFSRASLDLIGSSPAGRRLPDVLQLPTEQRESFATWLSVAFSGMSALDFDELKLLLPAEYINPYGKVVGLDYKPMSVSGRELSGVLMIATDLTNARALECEVEAMRRDAHRIRVIARSRNDFQRFIMDARAFLESCGGESLAKISAEGRVEMLRQFHTYKGVAATFALEGLAQAFHRMENAICAADLASQQLEFSSLVREAGGLVEAEIEDARNIFGDEFMSQGQVFTMDTSKIEALKSMARAGDTKGVLDFINWQVMAVPLSLAMAPFVRELYRVAEMQGKPQPDILWTGGDIPVLARQYDDVLASLIHVARNIMDHAIADTVARMIDGKTPQGQVRIDGRVDDEGGLIIALSDDGGGIDPAIIRARLAQKGLSVAAAEDDHAIIQHIFDAEFSTRDDVSMLSGRGIGLNAVKEEVEAQGGSLSVESWKGKGTRITLRLPPLRASS